jgi:alpha-galactosidase
LLLKGFFKPFSPLNAAKTTYRLRNVWAKKDVGTTKRPFAATVPAHDVVALVVSK